MNKLLKEYNEIVALFGNENSIQLEEETFLKYQDMLKIMKSRGYIVSINADNLFIFYKNANFADFKKWLKEQIKDDKKIKRRDFIIALISGIVGAIVGAVIGLIPWIVGQV